jgi:hypothetical protein
LFEDGEVGAELIRLIDAHLRYYYKVPQSELDGLTDEEWAAQWRDLEYIRSEEARHQTGV